MWGLEFKSILCGFYEWCTRIQVYLIIDERLHNSVFLLILWFCVHWPNDFDVLFESSRSEWNIMTIYIVPCIKQRWVIHELVFLFILSLIKINMRKSIVLGGNQYSVFIGTKGHCFSLRWLLVMLLKKLSSWYHYSRPTLLKFLFIICVVLI